MHELSICESILGHVEEISARENAVKVTKIILEIGCFAGVENDALLFSFDAISTGTIAQGATIEIIAQSGNATCLECGENFATDDRICICPNCNKGRIAINGGTALRIKNLEII